MEEKKKILHLPFFFPTFGEMAEWSIASDLKSDELKRFREFESHSLLFFVILTRKIFSFPCLSTFTKGYFVYSSVISITGPFLVFSELESFNNSFWKKSNKLTLKAYFMF